MKLSIVGLLVLGLFAAISAAVLMALLTVRQPTAVAVENEEKATVLVAQRDLAANTMIDAGAVSEQKVARDKMPAQSLSTPVQAIGKVLSVPMLTGQAFRKDMFVTEGSGPQLAASFPPGKRAVAVSLSEAASLDGVLYPGSVVDVILTLKGNEDRAQSRTVLEAVPVLAIERQTVIAKDAEKQDGGVSSRGSNSRRVTLLVDSRQAAIVQLAINEGALTLAMRNPLDKEMPDRAAVSLAQVMPIKGNSAVSWMEVLAATLARATAKAPTEPARMIQTPMAPSSATQGVVKEPAPAPKPGWQTTIIRGASVEKVEFPEDVEPGTLVRKGL